MAAGPEDVEHRDSDVQLERPGVDADQRGACGVRRDQRQPDREDADEVRRGHDGERGEQDAATHAGFGRHFVGGVRHVEDERRPPVRGGESADVVEEVRQGRDAEQPVVVLEVGSEDQDEVEPDQRLEHRERVW